MFLMAALSLRRSFMNVVRNYSEVEIKVREATCNDPWCPPSMLMAEISDMTYKACHLAEVMKVIWKRLGEKGRNWRHVYKSLILLEYLLKTGSENVYNQCKAKTLTLKQLQDFFFIDRKGQDQGRNIRELSAQLINLLEDDDLFKIERSRALNSKDRLRRTSMRMLKRRKSNRNKNLDQKKGISEKPALCVAQDKDKNEEAEAVVETNDEVFQQKQKRLNHPVVDLTAAAKSLTAIHDSVNQNQARQKAAAEDMKAKTNNSSTFEAGPLAVANYFQTQCTEKAEQNQANRVIINPSLYPQINSAQLLNRPTSTSSNENFTTASSTTLNRSETQKSGSFPTGVEFFNTPFPNVIPFPQSGNAEVGFNTVCPNFFVMPSVFKGNSEMAANPSLNPYITAMLNMQMEKMLSQSWKNFSDAPFGFPNSQNSNNSNPFS